MTEQTVVVGVDGSPTSSAALDWALEVAGRRGYDVDVVLAWTWDADVLRPLTSDDHERAADAAQAAVEAQLDKALADRAPGSPVGVTSARAVEGEVADVLLAASAGAALLVVGRHGTSALRRRLTGPVLGSVAAHCLSRSTVPVAVVPASGTGPLGAPRRVVVGVDGSPASVRALGWAATHAAAPGTPLTAVLTWQVVTLPPPPVGFAAGAVPPLAEWAEQAELQLDEAVAEALGPEPAVPVSRLVVHRPATAGLLQVARPDDVLVVGARGRGGFERLLLGSVSRQCAEHAPCPVVVVPERTGAGRR